MGENAQPTSSSSSASDSHSDIDFSVLVATLLTVVLATGSAFIWRSKLGFHLVSSDDADLNRAVVSSMEHQHGRPSSSGETAATKEGRHHRAKERRKRGKDPMKELIKAERKGKSILPEKSSHAQEGEKEQEQGVDTTASTATNGDHAAAKRDRSSDGPRSTSSRSASSVSVSSRASEPDHRPFTHKDPDATPSLHRPQPPNVTSFPLEAASEFAPEEHLAPSDTFSHASSSSSSSHITRTTAGTGSESSMTTLESSTSAANLNSPDHHSSHAHSSHFLMPSAHYPTPAPFQDHKNRLSGPRGQGHSRMSGSWEWDGTGTTSNGSSDPASTTTYKKPPRFRSKSRQSGSDHAIPTGVQPFALPFLSPPSPFAGVQNGMGNGYRDSHAGNSSTSPRLRNVEPADPTFASLNPTPVVTPSDEDGTPRVASESSQVASLKAALDASRSREEAAKKEAETYRKEVEKLRWEGTVWRQREAEMQAQLFHLSQQLQLATGYNPQMQMPPHASPSTHLHVPQPQPRSPSQTFRASSPQTFRASPSPSPQPPHQAHLPPHLGIHPLQMIPPPNQSPNLSPYLHSPGFFYPQHPQAISPGGAAHAPGPSPLFSMLFPHVPAHLQSPHAHAHPHLQTPNHLQSPTVPYPGVASSSGSLSPASAELSALGLGLGSPIRGRAGAGMRKKRSTGETIRAPDGSGAVQTDRKSVV